MHLMMVLITRPVLQLLLRSVTNPANGAEKVFNQKDTIILNKTNAMRKNILVILTLLVPPAIYAEKKGQARIDSMAQVIQTTREDTMRIKAWNLMSLDLARSGKPDSAKQILTSSLNLAKKINFVRGEANE